MLFKVQHKQYKFHNPRVVTDLDGQYICTVDSWGFRSQVVGECEECWQSYVQQYNDAQSFSDG